jgi:hypothetical protein
VAEGRNAAVPELRRLLLLLESESESIVGGSEVLYSDRRQRKAKRGTFERCAPRLYPYWLLYTPQPPTLVAALERPPSAAETTGSSSVSKSYPRRLTEQATIHKI